MVGDDQGDAGVAEGEAAPPQATDGGGGGEEILGGDASDGDDDPGIDALDLAQQEPFAGQGLGGLRLPVVGGATLEDVGDIDIFPLEINGFEHGVEESPRASDEGLALAVFVGAGRFADEHPVGGGRSDAEYGLGARFV